MSQKPSYDRGNKVHTKQFNKYCLDAGILQQRTITEIPRKNDVVERYNRTLLVMAKCLLIGSGHLRNMWGAILHAAKLKNLQGRAKLKNVGRADVGRTKRGTDKPKFSKTKPSFFGCSDFLRQTDRDVSKFEPKALEKKLWAILMLTKEVSPLYPTHAR